MKSLQKYLKIAVPIFLGVAFYSCIKTEDKLYNKWYLTKVKELNSGREFRDDDCQYLYLKENGKFESKGFTNKNGKYIVEKNELHLIDDLDTIKLIFEVVGRELEIELRPDPEAKLLYYFTLDSCL